MPVTLRNTDILFNDGTTQSSAAGSTTVLDAVGCVAMFWYSGGSNLTAGSTISGSNLFRFTTIAGSDSTYSIPPVGAIIDIQGIFSLSGNYVNRTTAISGNSKTLSPVSGTWRFMCFAPRALFDSYSSRTYFGPVIAVRIS